MHAHAWNRWRDRTVRWLARLSLALVLALLGALFVGTAATSQATPDHAGASLATDAQVVDTGLSGDRVRPAGVVVGAVVVGGGVVTLVMGAFMPPSRRQRRELAAQLGR